MENTLSQIDKRSRASVNEVAETTPAPKRRGFIAILTAALLIRLIIFWIGIDEELFSGMHVLVQGHPRYHIPLLPFMSVVAMRAFLQRSEILANRRSWRFLGAMSVTGIFGNSSPPP